MSFLDVLKVPFVKEISSDELTQVPNMPMVFDALCLLLKMQIQIPQEEISSDVADSLQALDRAQCEIANTISVIASEGVNEIKEQEASIEDKLLFGSTSSPMKRLYEKGTRNLIAISNSQVADALVNLIASGSCSNDLRVSMTEAIGCTALYCKVAERYAYMGVLKDLVR
jgi:uncharacterized protein YgbK (DUF1537 family)